MDFNAAPRYYTEAMRRRRAQKQMEANNPDRYGRVSTAAIIIAFGLLIGAIAVFTYHWVRIANENGETREAIDALRVEFDVIEAFVANFTTDCNCTGVNITFPTEFADNNFTIFDGGDPSSLLQFNANNITAGFLRRQTVQNVSGIVAYLSDIPTFPTVFLDSEFTIFNALDNSKKMMFNCSVISTGTTRIMTAQDQSGTIAYLADIPVPTSVFEDDVFAVQNAVDNSKEVQLDVSMVGSGFNVTMFIQDADGTIAFLDDIVDSNGTFSDLAFLIFHDLDPTAGAQFNVSANVSPGMTTVMTIQNSNGTIAYVDQASVYIDVTITSDRLFPSLAVEGESTLTDLGVTQLQIWMCGGGGGGGGSLDSTNSGGGGGSSSGVEKFFVDNAASFFSALNCTVGLGGAGGTGSTTTPTNGADGGTTSVIGIPLGEESFLELFAYGGGGGQSNGTGGAGGGSGSAASGNNPGAAGSEGGLAGGEAGVSGAFRYPWHAGSGGGEATVNDGAPWYGGGDGGSNGGGATGGGGGGGGLFGTGGDGGVNLNDDGDNGGPCAGGGGAAFTDSSNVGGDGGDGQIIIRYWII